MAWWNAKYKNDHGEYEITFGSKDYEKTKAVEKVCRAVIDKSVTCQSDIAIVVLCKNCSHSRLPSALTQRYGEPGTLTCHNRKSASNHRNVNENDFCRYGERKEGTVHEP